MLSLLLAATAAAAPPVASNYKVDVPMQAPAAAPAWSDEFDGKRLDTSKWRYDTSRNKLGWYNGEQQYYSADRRSNLRMEDGHLVIEARHDPGGIAGEADYGGQQYSSAKIVSESKASFRCGFVEVRAKLPCARGTWPAIWMMPERKVQWPNGGEIDIMEQVGSEPNLLYATLHTELFNHVRGTQRGAQLPLATSCSDFHRYQLSWTPDEITIGVDDRGYMQVRNDQPGGRGAWPFDQPYYLILNLAIGGSWAAAKGIDDDSFPQRFEVDYVRVWNLPAS